MPERQFETPLTELKLYETGQNSVEITNLKSKNGALRDFGGYLRFCPKYQNYLETKSSISHAWEGFEENEYNICDQHKILHRLSTKRVGFDQFLNFDHAQNCQSCPASIDNFDHRIRLSELKSHLPEAENCLVFKSEVKLGCSQRFREMS